MTPNMQMQFENSVAKIGWDASRSIMFFEWKKFAFGEPFREALSKQAQLAKQQHATKQFIDTTYAGAFRPEEQQYLSTTYIQEMHKAGTKHMALVVPESAVANMSQTSVIKTIRSTDMFLYEVETFRSKEEAITWLSSK